MQPQLEICISRLQLSECELPFHVSVAASASSSLAFPRTEESAGLIFVLLDPARPNCQLVQPGVRFVRSSHDKRAQHCGGSCSGPDHVGVGVRRHILHKLDVYWNVQRDAGNEGPGIRYARLNGLQLDADVAREISLSHWRAAGADALLPSQILLGLRAREPPAPRTAIQAAIQVARCSSAAACVEITLPSLVVSMKVASTTRLVEAVPILPPNQPTKAPTRHPSHAHRCTNRARSYPCQATLFRFTPLQHLGKSFAHTSQSIPPPLNRQATALARCIECDADGPAVAATPTTADQTYPFVNTFAGAPLLRVSADSVALLYSASTHVAAAPCRTSVATPTAVLPSVITSVFIETRGFAWTVLCTSDGYSIADCVTMCSCGTAVGWLFPQSQRCLGVAATCPYTLSAVQLPFSRSGGVVMRENWAGPARNCFKQLATHSAPSCSTSSEQRWFKRLRAPASRIPSTLRTGRRPSVVCELQPAFLLWAELKSGERQQVQTKFFVDDNHLSFHTPRLAVNCSVYTIDALSVLVAALLQDVAASSFVMRASSKPAKSQGGAALSTE